MMQEPRNAPNAVVPFRFGCSVFTKAQQSKERYR